MADWVIWFAIAGVLVAVEIFTGTFYLLMFSLGLAAGGIAALAGMETSFQFFAAGIVGAIGIVILKKSRFGAKNRVNAAHDPNVNLDIGRTLTVKEWTSVPGGPNQARVSYRGSMWDVELASHEEAKSGLFVIREIRANRLIVEHASD